VLEQQNLLLNEGQGQIWTWFKLDRRWWNAPLKSAHPQIDHWQKIINWSVLKTMSFTT